MKKFEAIDVILVTLVLTAAILLFGIARLDRMLQPPAFASGVTASAGDFVVTVGSLTDRDEELVYVIDTSSQRMASYRFDTRQKSLELVQQMGLDAMFRSATATSSPSKKPPGTGP